MLLKLQQQMLEGVRQMENRIEKLENSMASNMAELKKIIADEKSKSFSIKKSTYEVCTNDHFQQLLLFFFLA